VKVLRIAHHAVVSPWRQRERELRDLGIDITLVSAKAWNEGGVVVRLDSGGDAFVRGAATLGHHPSVFLFDPRPIWRALGERPDLIDLHEEPNALATAEVRLLRWLRRSRAPYLMYSAQNLEKRYPIPFRWFERSALRDAAGVYVCNREAGDILKRKGLIAPARYIPLGVDVQLFAPDERSGPAAKKVIGYVGRLEKHKGVDVLLRVIAAREEWELRVTGDGSQAQALSRLAGELGIADRVRFLGHASGEELAARYRELDVIAVPSIPWPGWSEQFCRVAIEAMASGVPVVASATGAIPDVVAEAGILVEPGDPGSLERGMEAALEPGEWKRLRALGLAHSRDFTWSKIAAEQAELYATAIGAAEQPVRRPDPQVLIVAYGSPDLLADCLDTLGPAFPVTVVDNSSLQRAREIAEAHGARYIDAGANLGFAGGVNLGLASIAEREIADADVLLLNPDARIDEPAVRRMQAALHESPRAAAVGATQTEPATGNRVRVWWPFPTPWGACVEAIGLGALRRREDFAIGSILMLRHDALDQIGPLDERFFLYAEETDWQFRARKLGWTIEVADVAATHEGGGTGGDPTVREAHFYGSAERYVRKHYGTAGWQVYRLANVAGAAVRGVLLPGERGAAARRRRAIFARGPVASEAAWM
jgi:glycosyltransferase involved in cell wall biosynthesis/GT2 family glycosyltransferase